MGPHQSKKFLHSKGNDQQNSKETYGRGETFANHISDKGLICEICKEPIQLNSKKSK